jgi:hypothetical protein
VVFLRKPVDFLKLKRLFLGRLGLAFFLPIFLRCV